jgi:hypothetical protein
MLYRKRPVIIEAKRWRKMGDHDAVVQAGEQHGQLPWLCASCGMPALNHGWVKTLEGGHIVCPGDWIITGVKGENYPCKPDIFEATYEAAE